MISFDEAVRLVAETATPGAAETIPIGNAGERVLSIPVVAKITSPRSAVSAMDGYAVREADLGSVPARLNIVGESFAGGSSDIAVGTGECVRIFTGAPVPEGADRVVIQEVVQRDGNVAIIESHPGEALHIRPQGGDFRHGDELLPAGRLLDPRGIVAAAAADVAELQVFARPRVQIVSTGDELAEPGTAAGVKGAIPESVSFGVSAMAEQWGASVIGRTRLADNLAAMEKIARNLAAGADLIVVTGGASVGERDFAKAMFEPIGLQLIFSKVAIKPGKPVWLGRTGRTLVMGLPGNPTSALVTARLLLAPLLAGMTGRKASEALRWRTARLQSPISACGRRETFHRGRWSGDTVEVVSNQDSSAQRVLAAADLLVRQSAGAPAQAAGEKVVVLDF